MTPETEKNDQLERLAARIADDQPVNWRELSEASGTSTMSGLREIEQLAQGFRHLQISAVTPNTPSSNRFKFGSLQVLEPLGAGTQGEVWRAYDPLLDLQVALKLRKVESDTLSHQFLEEARRLARVRQANIVSVYGAAVHGGRAGLWTELIRGTSLAELLDQHGAFPVDEVRGIGLDLCHALAAVHRHGLVHGDLKTENVMREVSGRIVLMDFGAAREFDRSSGSVVSGTLRYLAPEVLRGAAPSPTSDIYALGVLLFRLIGKAYPYAADDLDGLLRAQDSKTRKRLIELRPDMPKDLARVIENALDHDPARRPPTAMAFAAALAQPPAVQSTTRATTIIAALIAVGVLLLAAVFWHGNANAAWQTSTTFYRMNASGATPLVDGAPVAMGDRLWVQFQSSKPVYVYVFDDDGSGSASVMFPLAGAGTTNPLVANQTHRLPGQDGSNTLTWQISSAAEHEEFVVIASTQARPELEAAVSQWQHAGADTPAARGALGLSQMPQELEIASAQLRQVLERVEREQREQHNGEFHQWHFVFPHAKGA